MDQTSENYMVEFVVPVIAHQDARYYTLGHGGFLKRTGYALSRAVVMRSDSAKEEFNVREVLGAGVSAGLSSLHYPTSQRNFPNVGKEWGIDIGIDGVSFVAKNSGRISTTTCFTVRGPRMALGHSALGPQTVVANGQRDL